MIDNAFYKVTNNETKESVYCKTLHGAILKILDIEKYKANQCHCTLDEYVQDFSFWTWEDYCEFVGKNVVGYFMHKPKHEELFGGCWSITRFFFTA